ncbi:MAG TPA: hypothetical protein VNA14_11600 [Mycobacteriales bacterium]|nr:hypothetical protein [Mycobacteriales bacterium]
MKLTRLAAGAALAAAAAVVPVTPAQAVVPTAAVLNLQLSIGCYGCGPSSGSLFGTANGTGRVPLFGTVAGTFSINGPAATCPATSIASGSMSGSTWGVAFVWTQLGAVGVVSTNGGFNGDGTMTFRADSAMPCGGHNVTAAATMALGSPDEGGIDFGDPPPLPGSGSVDAYGYDVYTDDAEAAGVRNVETPALTHRSNHDHLMDGACDYNRDRNNVTISGWGALIGHAGPQSIRVQCELLNRFGSSILRVSSTQAGASGTVSGSTRTVWRRNRVCLTIEGIYSDGHIRYHGPICRSVS